MDLVKANGLLCGVGSHRLQVVEECEKTVELMQTVEKPFIAFKVMAAGAIPPQDAFQYAFNKGADFVLAGMFDFEIAQDARIAQQAFTEAEERARPWCA